jgi:hypothetical protein
MNSE